MSKKTYKLDTQLDLSPDTKKIYIVSSQHRKAGNPNKSLWTITIKDEIGCFIYSDISGWNESQIAWGLSLSGTSIQNLGINDLKEELKIAKFIDSDCKNIWHGYPADYLRKHQDRPGSQTLKKWREAGLIKKHQVIKIRKGIECNL